jgi:hypothetical protein
MSEINSHFLEKPYQELGIHGEARQKIEAARERLPDQLPTVEPSTFRNALFRVELRQEIHKAFILRKAPCFSVKYCEIDRTHSVTDDWEWTQRVIAQTADIMTHCFGKKAELWKQARGENIPTRWHALSMDLLDLMGHLPPSFEPFYQEKEDPQNGRMFPTLWYANDCHGMNLSYHITFPA